MTARKLQFVGALFDGRSSKKHRVDIELTPQEIILKEPGHEPVRWAAETSPFHIEHRVDDKNGKRLETLVVEDLDFYESVIRIAPKSVFATGKGPNFNWKLYSAGILVLIFSAYVFIK
ncbi:uncharacterized protein METZ01_LOCUS197718, partial [marine metagenome]